MNVTRSLSLVTLFFLMILLVVCQPFNAVLAANRPNTLTIWSFFPKENVERAIANYEAVHPDTKVIYTEHSIYSLASAFKERANQGLGPDMVILPEREIPDLIQSELIEKLNKYDLDTTYWHQKSLIPLRDTDGNLYGIPTGFQSMAMCYNRTQIDTPATTLNELLQQSRNGIDLAFEAGFLKSMWGIGLFGGQFFNSASQFVLQPQSVIQWLNWLQEAEKLPTIFFDSRPEFLYRLFEQEKLAYLPCWNFEFRVLKEKLQDKLGIAPLPHLNNTEASPYVEIDTLLVNIYANTKQKELAAQFGQFLASQAQQTNNLVHEDGQLITPINVQTKVNPRLFPTLGVLNDAVNSAVAFPISDLYNIKRILFYGNQLFSQVLEADAPVEKEVKTFFDHLKNPPPNEQIVVSSSASSEKFGGLVDEPIEPEKDYISDFLRIFLTTLRRPSVVLEISLFFVIILTTRSVANRINQWLKSWLN